MECRAQEIDARHGVFNNVQTQYNYNYHGTAGESNSTTLPRMENVFLSRTPPPPPEIFFGREHYVEKAVNLICSANGLSPARLAILGAGGMGKTSLALTILHHRQVQDSFQGQCFFVPCDALSSLDLLLSGIMQVIGLVDIAGHDPLTVLDAELRSPTSKLLVLDNFETPLEGSESSIASIEQLLQRIASAKSTTLIVTMRGNGAPSCIRWSLQQDFSPLPCLSAEEALHAFLAVNPTVQGTEQEKSLAALLKEVDYVPLAVSLLAHLGTRHPCNWLLRRYRSEHTALLKKRNGVQSRLDSLDVSIALSLKTIEKQPEAIQLLSLISHLPSGVLHWEEKLPFMASDIIDCDAATALLIETALAHVDSKKALRVLSPIRHYMLQHYPCVDSHVTGLAEYYCDLIATYTALKGRVGLATAMEELLPEKANVLNILSLCMGFERTSIIEAAMRFSDFIMFYSQPTDDFIKMIMPFLKEPGMKLQKMQVSRKWVDVDNRRCRFQEAFDRCQINLCECGQIGDKLGAAQCLQSLGDILRMQSKYGEATEKLTEAQDWFRDIGNHLGVAQCLQCLGDILRMQYKCGEASEKFKEAQDQFRYIGNHLGAAQCLQSLGVILLMQCKYGEAYEKFTEAQDQFREIGDQLGAAQCLQCLGDILGKQLKYGEGSEKLAEAQDQFRHIGDQLGAAQCLQSLGDILSLQSKYGEAAEKLTRAQDQFRDIGNHLGAAQCLQSLGNILRVQSKYREAAEKLTEAQDHFRDIGHHLGAAQCLQSLGVILLMQSKCGEASEKLTEAQDQFREIGDYLGAAQCLQCLGNTLRMQSKYGEAAEKLAEAKDHFRDIGDQLGAAQCLQSLGVILLMQSKCGEAAEKLTEAQDQFREIGDQLGAAQCLQCLGNTLRMQSKYGEASEKLAEAKDYFRDIGDQLGAAQCLKSLGVILLMQSRYGEASEKFAEAQDLFRAIGNQLGTAHCLQCQGDILRKQSKYGEAAEKLTDAQDQFRDIGDQLGSAQCLKSLGCILRDQHKYAEAGEKLQLAQQHYLAGGFLDDAAACLQQIQSFQIHP